MQIELSGFEPRPDPEQRGPVRIPVPWLRQETGSGDVVRGVARAVGVKPCTPCEARRKAMNQRVVFSPWGG